MSRLRPKHETRSDLPDDAAWSARAAICEAAGGVPVTGRNAKARKRQRAKVRKAVDRNRNDVAASNPPNKSAIKWNSDPRQGEIILPALGLGIASVSLALFGLTYVGVGLVPMLAMTDVIDVTFHGSSVVGWSMGALFVGIGIMLATAGIVRTLTREVVRERRDGLCFSLEFRGRSWRHRFLLKRSVEQVAVRRSPGSNFGRAEVLVQSDDVTVKLARHLSASETEWVAQALRLLMCR